MSRWMLVGITALGTFAAYATGFGLKPGLWEVRIVKQVVDGRDTTAQLAGASDKLQQAMANMPPEQRARLEAMLKQRGGAQGSNGGFRICVTPEMAQRDKPIVDKEGRCQPATASRNGNQTTYEFHCSNNGVTTSGKGTAVASGDLITTHVDMTTHHPDGTTRVMQHDSEMKFLGSDCGDVKPPNMPK